jgi:DNA-binding GntR family transcriptional regulator
MTLGQHHLTLRESVAGEIRRMIMDGRLAPGERLFEDRLAEQLGVSRNPVREAIRALEGSGLVEVRPRRGAYVSQLDPLQATQLLELRAVIEAYAARLAARNRSDDDLATLRRCLDAGLAASREGDQVRAATFHREFHIGIERASGNSHLEPVVGPLRHQTELVFSILADQRSVLSWDEHVRIYEAIAAGDEAKADQFTMEHMESVVSDLLQRAAP